MKKVRRRAVERANSEQEEQEVEDQSVALSHFQPIKTESDAIVEHPSSSLQQERQRQRETYGKRSEILISSTESKPLLKDKTTSIKNSIGDETSVSPNSQLKREVEAAQASPNPLAASTKASDAKSGDDERKNRIEMLKMKYLKKTPEIKIEMTKPVEIPKDTVPEIVKIEVPNVNLQETKPVEQRVIRVPDKVKEKSQQIIQPIEEVIKPIEPKIQHEKPRAQITGRAPPPRPEDRKVKAPPPPPNRTLPKPIVPPPPTEIVNNQQTQQSPIQIEKKESIQPKSQQVVTDLKAETAPIKPSFVPPPPRNKNGPSRSVPQEILSKRTKQAEQRPQIDQTSNQNIINADAPKKQEVVSYLQHKETVSFVPFYEQVAIEKPVQSPSLSAHLTLAQQIRLWINSPTSLLTSIMLNAEQLLDGRSAEKSFNFTSNNPNFSKTLSNFINQFVLKSKNELSEGQKQSLYTFSLEYFQSSDHQLTPQFFLILIKLGSPYLSKHQIEDIPRYAAILLANKYFFSNEELNVIINHLIEQGQVTQVEILHLLLIFPSQKLLNLLSLRSFNNIQYIISLLSAIQLQRRQFGLLMPVYLKLINTLIENLPQEQQTVEEILKHVNELQTNEKSYQLHKQIKLKLINILSRAQNPQKAQVKDSRSESKEEKSDGGLIGYWSKAVDKIKTATTQLVDLKQGAKQPVKKEEQQKEDDITYDPVLKRYLINGKVPDDENSRQSQTPVLKAPPPPKLASKPAPPPLPSKKGRVATNRYA